MGQIKNIKLHIVTDIKEELKKMSCQRGNASRQRTQKHKNDFAYKNDMHGVSQKQKQVNNLYVSNVCQRCKECIEWKIKYKKYKPLTVPSKCVRCSGKKVKFAYHIVCTECALQHKVCAKCNKVAEVIGEPEQQMKHMRLREKRALLRQMERGEKKQGGGGKGSSDGKENDSGSEVDSDDGSDSDYDSESET